MSEFEDGPGKGNPIPQEIPTELPFTMGRDEFILWLIAGFIGVGVARPLEELIAYRITDGAHKYTILTDKDAGRNLSEADVKKLGKLPDGTLDLRSLVGQTITLPFATARFLDVVHENYRDMSSGLQPSLVRIYGITFDNIADVSLVGEARIVNVNAQGKTTTIGLGAEKPVYAHQKLVGRVMQKFDDANHPTGEVFFDILGLAALETPGRRRS